MASVVDVRNKLLALIDNRKRLEHESQLRDEDFAKCKAERVKAEAARVEKYAEMLSKERKLEDVLNKLNENQIKIEELEKSAIECKKASDLASAKIGEQDDLILRLQSQMDEAQNQTVSSSKTYSETLDRFRDIQTASERVERREQQLQELLHELEHDKSALETRLKKLEFLESQASRRQEELATSIQSYNARLEQANQRAADAENTYEALSTELAMLEEEANDWAIKVRTLQGQLDSVRLSEQTT